MLAQISDGEIQFGRLFDIFKKNLDGYSEIIEQFSTLDLSKSKFKNPDGSKNWDKIAESIGSTDHALISYLKTLEDSDSGIIDNAAASLEGLADYIELSGESFDFAAIKATLFNAALNAGIAFLVTTAIQGLVKIIDDYIHADEIAIEKAEESKKIIYSSPQYLGVPSPGKVESTPLCSKLVHRFRIKPKGTDLLFLC